MCNGEGGAPAAGNEAGIEATDDPFGFPSSVLRVFTSFRGTTVSVSGANCFIGILNRVIKASKTYEEFYQQLHMYTMTRTQYQPVMQVNISGRINSMLPTLSMKGRLFECATPLFIKPSVS